MVKGNRGRHVEDEGTAFSFAAAHGRAIVVRGTRGDDDLYGTSGKDRFLADLGGHDTLRGLKGNDFFYFGAKFSDADHVNGGAGRDRVYLEGNYAHLNLGFASLRDIEALKLEGGGTFHITLEDGVQDLKIRAPQGPILYLDASAMSTGSVYVRCGNRADTIIGSQGNDNIVGGGGADVLTGGLGDDIFEYRSTLESDDRSFTNPDLITDFSQGDTIFLPTQYVTDFHFGTTAGHAGDIVSSFDSASDQTRLDIFVDGDDKFDMTILLSGDHPDLTIVDHTHIIGA